MRVPEESVLTGETLKGQPFPNTHMYTLSSTAVNNKEILLLALCFMSGANGPAGDLKE